MPVEMGDGVRLPRKVEMQVRQGTQGMAVRSLAMANFASLRARRKGSDRGELIFQSE